MVNTSNSLSGKHPKGLKFLFFLQKCGNVLISKLLGNLYNNEKYKDYKDAGYSIFYMGINIGAFICNFVAVYMHNNFEWRYAFLATGVGMLVGVIIFLSGTNSVEWLPDCGIRSIIRLTIFL